MKMISRELTILHAEPKSQFIYLVLSFFKITWLVEALCYKPEGRGFESR
jgi:hypothetical protein